MSDKNNGKNPMDFISELVIYNKYASHKEELKRRQTWEEAIGELEEMQMQRYPHLTDEIRENFKYVYDKSVMPSMRSVQFSGKPILFNNAKMFNCSYGPIDHPYFFAETAFLLLAGSGLGYNVGKKHIKQLPVIVQPVGTQKFLVSDTSEGIADSFKAIIYAYTKGKPLPRFEYGDVRKKGTIIKKSGNSAPGPERTAQAHMLIGRVLSRAVGRKLTPLECLDIENYIADSIVSGGVREAAMISLCDKDETDVITCKGVFKIHSTEIATTTKTGWILKYKFVPKQIMNTNTYTDPDENGYFSVFISNQFGDWDLQQALNGDLPWYYIHPQRGKSNNSVNFMRYDTTYSEFASVMKMCEDSKAGEPGSYWNNDEEMGVNPCFSGTQMLATENGYETMFDLWKSGGMKEYDAAKQLEDYGYQYIINDKGTSIATNVFRTSTREPIYAVNMADGSSIEVTKEHNFIIVDKKGNDVGRIKMKDLEEGMLIKPAFPQYFGDNHDPEYAKLAGWVIGDGTVSTSKCGQQNAHVTSWNDDIVNVTPVLRDSMLSVYSMHNMSSNQNPKYAGYLKNTDGFDHDCHEMDSRVLGRLLKEDGIVPGRKHKVPSSIWKSDKETVAAFLQGFFSADGCVWDDKGNDKKGRIAVVITQVKRQILDDIKLLLSQFGIYSYITKQRDATQKLMNDGKGGKKLYDLKKAYRLIIGGIHNCRLFKDNIGFIQQYKNESLCNWLSEHKGSNNTFEKRYVKIASISLARIDETFCLTEPVSNKVIVNGFYIGQCNEAALLRNQFCNLTTQNVFYVKSQQQLNKQSKVAAFIGTLQAGWTDFHYLRPIWRTNTEKDALLGVSMTGVASGEIFKYNLREAAGVVLDENERIARSIGINLSARTTLIKPEGSTPPVMKIIGNGIHGAHSKHILKSFRIKKQNAIYQYLVDNLPPQFIEDEFNNEKEGAVLFVPIKADMNGHGIYRNEPIKNFLDRVKYFSDNWIKPGHRSGANMHNVSATVSVRPGEWSYLTEWMWDNRNSYNGLSALPYSDHNYKQAPFEEIDETRYNDLVKNFPCNLDLTEVKEEFNTIDHAMDTKACGANGACEI